MAELRARDGTAARALEFAILAAARTGEVRGARWQEIDMAAGLWTIPASRMKAGREHRVPLSTAAQAILQDMAAARVNDFVFPNSRRGGSLSVAAMLKLLKRMGKGDLTAHGFRSTFSDWCAEQTSFPSEVREMALAHAVGDKVEAAYRRGDLFEKRRQLAEAWAHYCGGVELCGEQGRSACRASGLKGREQRRTGAQKSLLGWGRCARPAPIRSGISRRQLSERSAVGSRSPSPFGAPGQARAPATPPAPRPCAARRKTSLRVEPGFLDRTNWYWRHWPSRGRCSKNGCRRPVSVLRPMKRRRVLSRP
jgi:hypothetical protein